MPRSCVSGVVGDDGRELGPGLGGFEPASENGLDCRKYNIIINDVILIVINNNSVTLIGGFCLA